MAKRFPTRSRTQVCRFPGSKVARRWSSGEQKAALPVPAPRSRALPGLLRRAHLRRAQRVLPEGRVWAQAHARLLDAFQDLPDLTARAAIARAWLLRPVSGQSKDTRTGM